jgi:glycosyltransferase involved in cell wall biosynthesis
MGVYKGEQHLPAQLDSIAQQEDADWCLLASDDSPNGCSRAVLTGFAAKVAQDVALLEGQKAGFSANYLHLLRHAKPGMLAFADQDDVWLPEKLARARAALARIPSDCPALYCARVWIWDGDAGSMRTKSLPHMQRAPSFANALVENIAIGNTLVLNAAAAKLARTLAVETQEVFAHDWWLYLLISGVGGTVLTDGDEPVVLYRQHGGNAIGSGVGLRAQLARKRAVLRGSFANRLTLNARALEAARPLLTPKNRALLDSFEAARAQKSPARLVRLARLGLYRQTRLATCGFWGAAAIGRV